MSKNTDAARDFFRRLKTDDVAPIYLVHGAETYLLDRAVDAIVEAAAPGGANDFNYNVFHGKGVTGDQIRSAAEMLPMFAPRRIVVVRDLQEMATSELDAFEDYFTNPSPTTCLIFHARTSEKSLNGNAGIIRKLKKAAVVGEFKALYESEVGSFLGKLAAQRKLRLTRGAEAYLLEAVGTDLAQLDQAMEKIDLYVGAAPGGEVRTVDVAEVEAVIAQTRVRSVFDLTDALGNRQFETALKILDRMLVSGEPALRITAMITRHFRILYRMHDPTLRSSSGRDLASAIGVSPYFVRDYQRHARQFSLREVERVMQAMLEVDIALKSSNLADRTILEGLLLDICFRRSSGAEQAG